MNVSNKQIIAKIIAWGRVNLIVFFFFTIDLVIELDFQNSKYETLLGDFWNDIVKLTIS